MSSMMLTGIGGGSAFSPTSIAGLQAWYDSSDAASFTFSSGNIVSQWNDKSGNGRHVSQGVVANQPARSGTQNGLATVVFDGTNDVLTRIGVVIAQPFTWLFTGKRAAALGGAWVSGQAGGAAYTKNPTGFWALFSGTELISATSVDTSWHQATGLANGAASTVRLDGAQIVVGNSGAGNTTDLGIGGNPNPESAWLNGEVGEVLLYTGLGATDRGTLEAYLKAKWGTP